MRKADKGMNDKVISEKQRQGYVLISQMKVTQYETKKDQT